MKEAHDLVEAEAARREVDILLLSEPNKKLAKQHLWHADDDTDAAIAIKSAEVSVTQQGRGKGFAWADVEGYRVYSCYVSPNIDKASYERFLDALGDDLRTTDRGIVLGGDFNAKSYLWGHKQDARGGILAEWMVQHRLDIINMGDKPTFVRRNQESVLDLTMCSGKINNRLTQWTVLEEETLSFHKMIYFELAITRSSNRVPNEKARGWKISAERLPKFEEELAANIERQKPCGTEWDARTFTTCVTSACDKTFRKKKNPKGDKAQVYWWNAEICEMRRECISARRVATRAGRRGTAAEKDQKWAKYKEMRANLRKAIMKSKTEAWKTLIDDLDNDIFGQGYRLVTNKLRRRTNIDDDKQLAIARELFPQKEEVDWRAAAPMKTPPPLFTEEELTEATGRLKNGKAAGPDDITPEVAKIAATSQKEAFLLIANNVIKERRFPMEWKTARLVLIEKPKKNPTADPSFRPICLLNTLGKIVEDMLCKRINLELELKGGLSPRQFGFRKGRSTIDAMTEVVKCVKAGTRERNTRGFSILITLDIRNAFNSADWTKIIGAMIEFGISEYLVETVRSYLNNRTIIIGEKGKLTMTCGVPQGSKLGPLLWNVMYDGVLRLDLPDGATVVGFADDVGLVVTAWSVPELKEKSEVAVDIVATWLKENGLQIAPEKTEAVILAGRRTLLQMDIQVLNTVVGTSNSIKYLGMHFDKDMRMKSHIIETAKKAGEATKNLSRLMPNIGGPASKKRKVLNAVVNSILLYAAPVWAKVIKMDHYKHQLERVQRQMALRISSAYRTVSLAAVQVLAGTTPIDLLVRERALLYEKGKEEKANIQEETLRLWQERWEVSTKGEWTRRLIPDIERWVGRDHGDLDFHLTQILSGHGCFEAYLYRIGKRTSATCLFCGEEEDTAEHTFFVCSKWEGERAQTRSVIGQDINPENLTTIMLVGEENFKAIKILANKIMRAKEGKEKEDEERRRRGRR